MARTDLNAQFEKTSFLWGGNAQFIEQLYDRFLEDPQAVDEQWREFFVSLDDDRAQGSKLAKGASWRAKDWPSPANGDLVAAVDGNWQQEPVNREPASRIELRPKELKVSLTNAEIRRATLDSIRALMIIRAYRMRGHLAADLDPLKLRPPQPQPELEPASYGFGESDLDRPVFIDRVLGLETATMRQILEILRRTYCSTLGVEFMHISDPQQKAWIQERIEGPDKSITFTPNGKKAILNKLIETEGFEQFLNVKYTGTKRFGIDGSESMVPALEQIIKRGGALGIQEIVFGMAHRGRLNVLANVMGKSFSAIFHEFKGGSINPDDVEGSGDVKYHLGSSSDREFDGNKVHLSLTANPSHLEIVDPVVLGKVRAKQDQRNDEKRTTVMPLLIHGDAAFAGQGVVAECFGLSGLRGHRSGGTLHFIVNNQIGFTTSPIYARSSPYPSDVAKMIEAPIFHANGDDPEAVVYASKIATEFRQKFRKPVVVDMFCYRRFGHNETDEPAFTQPIMYKKIAQHPTAVEIYSRRLTAEGVVSAAEVEAMKAGYRKKLDENFAASESFRPNKADWLDGRWAHLKAARLDDDPRRGTTGVPIGRLKAIGLKATKVPANFKLHRTLQRILENRRKMIEEGQGIDWSMAEALAFGTLLDDGFKVRLSGQDVQRGTFSQRHAVLIDQETEKRFTPLNHLVRDQKVKLEVINSMLSEEAVLGFEYGYSLAEPNTLVLWEAQFGDFANGAQVVVDQFISSGERKWLRMSGLVMLLPHGYEGQGPEHSSARLERYLQICAEDNLQVANCTTPANYFHILRRQLWRDFRKPLILMTPKSLLRHKRAMSGLTEMAEGSAFHRVLYDDAQMLPNAEIKLVADEKIKRLILCSGKIYFDLYEERIRRGINDIYLMRLEQLYPFPHKAMVSELARFPAADVVWCQEEPQNMGAWTFVQPNIEWVMNYVNAKVKRPAYVGRPSSASTATGLMSRHQKELKELLEEAFTGAKSGSN
jgi:2-oxoglutarate dehydrogenase E1 component